MYLPFVPIKRVTPVNYNQRHAVVTSPTRRSVHLTHSTLLTHFQSPGSFFNDFSPQFTLLKLILYPALPSIYGTEMIFSLPVKRSSNFSTLYSLYPQFLPHLTAVFDGYCADFQICSFYQRRRPIGREKGYGGEKVLRPCGSALPLSRMLHFTDYCTIHRSHHPIPFVLPHPSAFCALQEKMLISTCSIINVKFVLLPYSNVQSRMPDLQHRRFSSDRDDDLDSDTEFANEENEGDRIESSADPNDVDRVCRVIEELFGLDRNMEAVLDECGINLSHDLVLAVLDRFKQAWKPAFRFFCWAGRKPWFAHNSANYNSMMSILGRTRQFETMVSILEEMAEKELLTMETFTIAFKAFAAAKERKKALGMFELMKKHKYKVGVDTINCLLDSLGRAKLGREAQMLFDKLRGRFTPNLQTYTVILNGWCRVKNLVEIGRVWNEMIEEGLKPDIVAHNTMLEGLIRCQKRSDVIKFFEIMKAKGPSPNVRSYTILIRDFCKQRKMNEAVDCFDEMVEVGCQPDRAVYTCLITGFGNLKRMDVVFEVLEEMKQKGCSADGHTYNALIKLMTGQRMPDDAARVYKKMNQTGIKPTIHTFNMLMKSYFQARNYEAGAAVWEEMKHKGCCPDDNSFTVLIGGLISWGKPGEACKHIEEMIRKGMKAPQIDYNKFAADFSRAGKPDALEELAQKMKFAGKFEASNAISNWAEMMKKRVKRRSAN